MKKNTSVVWIICSIILLFLFMNCGKKGSEWGGSITQENGVIVVKNPIEPKYGPEAFSLEEELSIGESEGKEEYMFQEITNIAVNEAGDIYVADYKAKHIKVFDKDGKYIRTFGRSGQGPGEFQFLRTINCTNQNEIVVGGLNRVSYFNLEGEFQKSLSMGKQGLLTIDIDSHGNIFGYAINGEKGVYELQKYDPELKYLSAFGSSPLPSVASAGGAKRSMFFSLLRWDIINGDQIVCGYAKEGYILKIIDADGNLVKRIEKKYESLKITQKVIKERIQEYREDMRENLFAPEYYPPFRWMSSDDEGRIYVITYEKPLNNEGHIFDIFDADGVYILKTALKTRPHVIKNNLLYSVEEDEDGFHVVKKYRINWNLQ